MNVKVNLFIAFILITACLVPAQTKRALIIGINRYQPQLTETKTLRSSWTDLDGCINDAAAVKEIIKSGYGFTDKDIIFMTDSTGDVATRQNILSAIEKGLLEKSQEGDIVLIYFAGHGSRVKNSLSPEPDKRDETIVPSDAWMSTTEDFREIRDKELAVLIKNFADKKILLTLIFDSCHSGSIARGNDRKLLNKSRFLEEVDEIDLRDRNIYPEPEKQPGILIFSAAQDFQSAKESKDEKGEPHGAFTSALIKVLKNNHNNISAQNVFAGIKAAMSSNGIIQDPVIAGTSETKEKSFLDFKEASHEKIYAGIIKTAGGRIYLQAGLEAGIVNGCEFIRIGEAGLHPLKLLITETGLSRSSAEVIEGSVNDINPADLFEMSAFPNEKKCINIYIPQTDLSETDFIKMADEFNSLEGVGTRLIPEDEQSQADYKIFYENKTWKIKNNQTLEIIELGNVLHREKIIEITGSGVKIFTAFPLPGKIREELLSEFNKSNSPVKITSQETADYRLSGCWSGGSFRILFKKAAGCILPEPVVAIVEEKEITEKIKNTAVGLARIKTWLVFEAPADPANYPYKLCIMNFRTGGEVTDSILYEGETYGLFLSADSLLLEKWNGESRFVYVIGVDGFGRSTLLFPASGSSVENKLPIKGQDVFEEIILGKKNLFKITPPLGTDTFILFSSSKAITDLSLFNISPGVTENKPGPEITIKRGEGTETDDSGLLWSVQRIHCFSKAKL